MMKLFLAALAAVMVLVSGCANIPIPSDSREIQIESCFYAPLNGSTLKKVSKEAFSVGLPAEILRKVDLYKTTFERTVSDVLSAEGYRVNSRGSPATKCDPRNSPPITLTSFFSRFPDPQRFLVEQGIQREGQDLADRVARFEDFASGDAKEAARSAALKTAEVIRAARKARVIVGAK